MPSLVVVDMILQSSTCKKSCPHQYSVAYCKVTGKLVQNFRHTRRSNFDLCSTELLQCRAPPVEGWRDPTQRWRHCSRSKYVVLELDCTRCPQGPSRTYHKLLCANAAAAAGCQSSAPAVSTSYDPVTPMVVFDGYK